MVAGGHGRPAGLCPGARRQRRPRRPRRSASAGCGSTTARISRSASTTPSPTLSWKLSGSGAAARQSAYEVRVSTATGPAVGLRPGRRRRTAGDLRRHRHSPRARSVSWQVRVWDGNGDASDWSAPSSFEMGLLAPSDWGAAKWIQLPPPPLNRGVVDRRRRAGRALRAARRHQARPAALRVLLRHRLAHPARRDAGARRRRDQRRRSARASPPSTSSSPRAGAPSS